MKLLVASDIVRSIGAQSDFMITEILRTGACHREWQRALAFASDHGALDLTRLDELSPRIRRLIDLLSVADELALPYCDIGIHPAHNAPFASAA